MKKIGFIICCWVGSLILVLPFTSAKEKEIKLSQEVSSKIKNLNLVVKGKSISGFDQALTHNRGLSWAMGGAIGFLFDELSTTGEKTDKKSVEKVLEGYSPEQQLSSFVREAGLSEGFPVKPLGANVNPEEPFLLSLDLKYVGFMHHKKNKNLAVVVQVRCQLLELPSQKVQWEELITEMGDTVMPFDEYLKEKNLLQETNLVLQKTATKIIYGLKYPR